MDNAQRRDTGYCSEKTWGLAASSSNASPIILHAHIFSPGVIAWFSNPWLSVPWAEAFGKRLTLSCFINCAFTERLNYVCSSSVIYEFFYKGSESLNHTIYHPRKINSSVWCVLIRLHIIILPYSVSVWKLSFADASDNMVSLFLVYL